VSKEAQSSDHVYLYKLDNSIIPGESDRESQSSVVPLEKKRSVVFNLGMVAYRLLTGAKCVRAETEEEYLAAVREAVEHAEKRVARATKDKALGGLVGRMLSNNVFDLP
jgi:hypothetical protein